MIKIVIDAMGGDFAPAQQVKGAVEALAKDKELSVVLTGDESAVKAELSKYPYDPSRVEIVHAPEVITNDEVPTKAVKTKKNSSTVVAFQLLKEGKADALVSSGATGAVLTAAVLILGRIKGISRPALCPRIPNLRGTGTLLCDCGANLECKPLNLAHFAMMATAYAQAAYGMENPKVGLLNNGTEDHKGDAMHQEANALLKAIPCIAYEGNVEGRDIMVGDVDIAVADGFTGNICLKAYEGVSKFILRGLKDIFMTSALTKLSALGVKKPLARFRKKVDTAEYGGSPILGLCKPVIKAHGSSDARAFANAIRQATRLCESGVLDGLEAEIAAGAGTGGEG